MNKKIPIGIGIAAVVIVVMIVSAKAYFGDSATELPGEEKMEKTLNLQESGGANAAGEAGESGEANEAEETVKNNP
jgi:hypothetical protein